MPKLAEFYARGVRASDKCQHFQVWGCDLDLDGVQDGDKYIPADSIAVPGELGADWAEIAEVAWHYNRQQDGYFYYVGDLEEGYVLLPSWRELREICNFAAQFPEVGLTPEEKLALEQAFG